MRAHKVGAERCKYTDGGHAEAGGPEGQPQLHAHAVRGQQVAKQLLQKHVGRQKHSDGDRCEEEAVGPGGLGTGRHELLVVQAYEQADGEERQQAPVESLGHKDHVHTRS